MKAGRLCHDKSYLSLKTLAKTSPAYICAGKASSDQVDTLQIQSAVKSWPPLTPSRLRECEAYPRQALERTYIRRQQHARELFFEHLYGGSRSFRRQEKQDKIHKHSK